MSDPNRKTWVVSVDHVVYRIASARPGKPPCLVAVYSTSGGEYKEFVGIEGEGFARCRAEMWWAAHCGGFCPGSTTAAMAEVNRAMCDGGVRQPVELLIEQLPTQRSPSVAAWRFW
jgi:hypothetical protein